MNLAQSLTLLALTLQGCLINSVTKLDPAASKVEVVPETEKPSECKFLGKITGRSHASDEKEARKGAENELRNKTAELKGNFAIIENVRGGRVGTTSQQDVVINGKAYDCQTLDMQLADEEKQAQAVQEKEASEAKAQQEKEDKAAEDKAKREQAEQERKDKDAAKEADAEAERKTKKSKKSAADDS